MKLYSTLLATAVAAAPSFFGRLENLVAFGDSYTDEGRANYFVSHNGQAPPLGQLLPPTTDTATGGYTWGRLVANESGSKYYNYAVSGAMCSQNLVTRPFFNGLFPDVLEYGIPTFEHDIWTPLYPDRWAGNTVYALWVGTNDLGVNGYLADKQKAHLTLTSYMDCIWAVFDHIYWSGGRNFVLLNQAPLEYAPMYATPGRFGGGNNRYLADPAAYNVTEFSEKLREYTTTVNTLFDYGVASHQYENRWPGARFSVFDVHSLMMDMIDNPNEYFDAPADVTTPYRDFGRGGAVSPNPPSSFFWYDELHPSERTSAVVAHNFIDVVYGRSRYGKTYRSR